MESSKMKQRRIVVVPNKKNKKFEVKKADTHPALPKAPKKKKGKKVYFDMDVQNAIVDDTTLIKKNIIKNVHHIIIS